MYGYLDESGAPGVHTSSNDFLVVSLVLFTDKKSADSCSSALDRLRRRLGLADYYEFHMSHNSNKVRTAVIKLLPHLDFQFITIAIKKSRVKNHGSYPHIARLLARELKENCSELRIEMDSNPVLYAELKRELRANKLKSVRLTQVKSHSNNLVQLADYVANLSAKKVKNTPKALNWYRPLIKKQLVFLEIGE